MPETWGVDEPMLAWPQELSRRDPALTDGSMTVGVVIVNWNTRHLLARLLYGLVKVVTPGMVTEIVVVDNASDDGSLGLARALSDAGVLRLLANDQQRYHGPGLTQGVNVLSGLAHRGNVVDLVWVLDTDILILRPDVLTDAVAVLQATGAVLAGERADYSVGPAEVTTARLALCSLLFMPQLVWRPENRPFLEDGEPSRQLQADLVASGHALSAFPFCTRRYLVHLGRSTLAEVRYRAEHSNRYHQWAQTHSDPHYARVPEGARLAAQFESDYRAAVGNDTTAALVKHLTQP